MLHSFILPLQFKRLLTTNLRAVIGHHTVKLVLCRQLVALVQIQMHRVPQE